jgi:hypothetical protein
MIRAGFTSDTESTLTKLSQLTLLRSMRILSICYQLSWNHYTLVSLCVFAPLWNCTTGDKKVSSEPYGLMYTNNLIEEPFIFMS